MSSESIITSHSYFVRPRSLFTTPPTPSLKCINVRHESCCHGDHLMVALDTAAESITVLKEMEQEKHLQRLESLRKMVKELEETDWMYNTMESILHI